MIRYLPCQFTDFVGVFNLCLFIGYRWLCCQIGRLSFPMAVDIMTVIVYGNRISIGGLGEQCRNAYSDAIRCGMWWARWIDWEIDAGSMCCMLTSAMEPQLLRVILQFAFPFEYESEIFSFNKCSHVSYLCSHLSARSLTFPPSCGLHCRSQHTTNAIFTNVKNAR